MFAKLFDTPHGQLLAVVNYDVDYDTHSLVIRGENVGDVVPQAIHHFENEAQAEEALRIFEQPIADETAAMLARVCAPFSQPENDNGNSD